jgi:hypothetical protein
MGHTLQQPELLLTAGLVPVPDDDADATVNDSVVVDVPAFVDMDSCSMRSMNS